MVARDASHGVPFNTPENLSGDLLSVETQNDTQNDLPSATVTLGDSQDWTMLSANDYLRIDVVYNSNTFNGEAESQQRTTIFCGLVVNVRKQVVANSNSRTYIVTAQGMAKVLQSLTLGTFSELTSQNATVQMIPDDEKTGIKVSERSSQNIIKQILERFILQDKGYIDYQFSEYGGPEKGIKDFIKTDLIENPDESQSVQNGATFLSNYNGSILQMIKDTASRPFNELFWTHEEGVATLHYRPTPFDPNNWFGDGKGNKGLDYITLEPNSIIKEQVDKTDQDQSSVFKLLPSPDAGLTSVGWAGSVAPLTNKKLIERYGYKIMEVQTDYFNGTDNSDDESKYGSAGVQSGMTTAITEADAKQHYPDYLNITDIFAVADGVPLHHDVTVPVKYGGNESYNNIIGLLQQKDITKAKFLQTAPANIKGVKLSPNQIKSIWSYYQDAKKKGKKGNNRLSAQDYIKIIDPRGLVTNSYITKDNKEYKILRSKKAMKKHPKKAANALIKATNSTLGPKQAYEIIQAELKGKLNKSDYDRILSKYKYNDQEYGVTQGGNGDSAPNQVPAIFKAYTTKLFNWYADNSKFYSGTITINGTSKIEIGKRLYVHDTNDGVYWEYYIESVSHSYSYTQGWITSIGVTRGLPVDKVDSTLRFTPGYTFWGQSEDFLGGYFGEVSLAKQIEEAKSSGGDGDADGSGSISGGKGVKHWGRNSVPKDVKKYIHDPHKAGLAWANSSGWFNPGDQCVHFSSSYFALLWTGLSNRRVMVPEGKDSARMWASANGGKTSKTPHAGAIASCPGSVSGISTSGAGHTWIVLHVLSNGDTIIAEQNMPGLSGEGNGTYCTWNFGRIPKSVSDKYVTYYTPGKGHKLTWGGN